MHNPKTIRNFSIIAHIDHGKSTLADRMLEITGTIEERSMKDQVLDNMDLERERGITIKMRPVSMKMTAEDSEVYTLNLIDTPGHIDFQYEVSRALKAVEGTLLLVDATQGIQAQTLTTLNMAQELNLLIIPVITKIDSPLAQIDEVKLEIAEYLGCDLDEIYEVSGKTGEGVRNLLLHIINKIPPPEPLLSEGHNFRGLIFDFEYSPHKGVILYVRVIDGTLKTGGRIAFKAVKKRCGAVEIGVFHPEPIAQESLSIGDIGYIVTGIKEAGMTGVGDTVVVENSQAPALPGYQQPIPVVWASLYPESPDDFPLLGTALSRLRLSDSSFTYEEETSGVLGRGYRVGFLGMLHLEIITERLRREFNLDLILTTPSVTYEITKKNGSRVRVYSPPQFPDYGDIETIEEPWVSIQIMSPNTYLSEITQLLFTHEAEVTNTKTVGDRVELSGVMPLRELMRGFFDMLKSISSGYGSIAYEPSGVRFADVVKLEVLVADEVIPAFTRIVSRRRMEEEAKDLVEKLHASLPRQMFVVKIQGRALGRIMSSETLKAFRKDVTAKLYGGDITRKMKLREKQKKGKKKMANQGKVHIPQDVFLKMMK